MADFGITEALAAVGLSSAAEAGTAAASTAAIAEAAGSTAAGLSAGEAAAAAASLPEIIGASAPAASSLPSLGTVASYAGPVLSAGGTLLQAQAQGRQGEYAAAVARAQAADQEAKANQEAAAGEQRAQQVQRQGDYVMSTLRARQASSGALPEGADTIAGDIAGQNQYNTLASLYAGLSGAQASRRQATIDLFGARNVESGIAPAQTGTILAGLSSFLDKRARLKYYSTVGESPLTA